MSGSNNSEAVALFTKVFMNLTVRWSEVSSFRHVVRLGLPHARAELASENIRAAGRFLEDPENDAIFSDKKLQFVERVGGNTGMGAAMTKDQISIFNVSVDAASLVFMHSALDASVVDLCKVCWMVAPTKWERFVRNQKVSLAEVQADGYDRLLNNKIEKYLKALGRRSLIEKVDRLFAVCKPTVAYSRLGYSYDPSRLAKIDTDRHRIIHGDGVALANLDSTIEFLLETGLYLAGMVNHCYDVRLDPQLAMQAHGWGGLSAKS